MERGIQYLFFVSKFKSWYADNPYLDDASLLLSVNSKRHPLRQTSGTCLYGHHLAVSAVAQEVGGNDVRRVVGAAHQALDLTAQIHGLTAVKDAITVLHRGDVEDCKNIAPGHGDGVGSAFLHR